MAVPEKSMTHSAMAQTRTESSDIYSRSNLTRLQVLYWIAQQLRPTSPFLNTVLTFTIDGAVDCDHFEAAFCMLVHESDALRTVVDEVDAVPQGRVLATVKNTLEHLDFSRHSEPEVAARGWIQEQSVVPLKISERLFHAALIKVSNDRFIWYFNQHHIIADATSFFLVFEHLAELYERSKQVTLQEASPLPSFQEYVEYERAYRESANYSRAKAYWQSKLEPGPEPIRFFAQTPVKKTTRVERVTYDLGEARSKKLRALVRQEGIFTVSEDLTLYSLFAAVFFVLLHHLSGNRRLGFVTPVHNRFSAAFKKTIGLVMELCPLQVEISEVDSFLSLLKKVTAEIRETMAYYQYASGLAIDQTSFDVMFNLHRVPSLNIDGLPAQVERIHPGHGSESLVLHINDYESIVSFKLHFDFHSDVFNEGHRKRTVGSFVELIDLLIEDLSRPLHAYRPSAIVQLEVPSRSLAGTEQLARKNGTAKTAPTDLLEFKLVQIWEELLGSRDIGIHDDFFDLGGNSWLAVIMIARIEKETGHYLTLNTLLRAKTIAQLAAIIREGMGDEFISTLITIQGGNEKPPLFCVPGAGGNGLAIARIARYLDSDQPVYMFQMPLVRNDRGPHTEIEKMATHYLEALQKVQQRGPYFLAGYSAGGIVAFEVAQQLQKKGEEIALLAIIDVPAQSRHYRYVRHFSRLLASLFHLKADTELQMFLALRDTIFRSHNFLQHGFQKLVSGSVIRLEHLGDVSRSRELMHDGANQGEAGGPDEVHGLPHLTLSRSLEEGDREWRKEDRWMRKYYDINNRAVKTYFPQTFPGQIILFRSSDGYQRAEMRSANPQLGWAKIAEAGVKTYVIPGNHMQIVREPNVQLLGRQLQSCLEVAQKQAEEHINIHK